MKRFNFVKVERWLFRKFSIFLPVRLADRMADKISTFLMNQQYGKRKNRRSS